MADIISTLVEMRNGEVVMDINRKFGELLTAVLETTGKGSMTIKLNVAPSKCAMGGSVIEVETTHECVIKKPELPVGKAVFFVTKDGALTREDPAQAAMFENQEVQGNG